jgi:hypothetical protein
MTERLIGGAGFIICGPQPGSGKSSMLKRFSETCVESETLDACNLENAQGSIGSTFLDWLVNCAQNRVQVIQVDNIDIPFSNISKRSRALIQAILVNFIDECNERVDGYQPKVIVTCTNIDNVCERMMSPSRLGVPVHMTATSAYQSMALCTALIDAMMDGMHFLPANSREQLLHIIESRMKVSEVRVETKRRKKEKPEFLCYLTLLYCIISIS